MRINDAFDIVYVIALPQRISYITNVMNKMGIKFVLFPAIHKDNIDIKTLLANGTMNIPNTFHNKSDICCSLSHLSVVKNFFNDTRYKTACIFEDDVVLDTEYEKKLSENIKDLPKDWEFFNMGRCWSDCYIDKKIGSVASSIRMLCTHSYAITKNGAKKILKKAYPMYNQIDAYYSRLQYTQNLKMYGSSPRIFDQDINEKSTLGNDDDKRECASITHRDIFSYLKYYKSSIITIIVFSIFIIFLKYHKILRKAL
jgi:GR25 family glycosyltransferase involved in LPS biosynthesis